jgi:hypothetical protein
MSVSWPRGIEPLNLSGAGTAQPLEIRMDPRVKTSPEDLQRQFDLDRKIADALHRDFEAIRQVRTLREQLKALTDKRPNAEIAKAIGELETKAAVLEGDEGGYGARFLSTPDGRSLARLNSGLGTLLSALVSADAAPTTQQSDMFGQLSEALHDQMELWSTVKSFRVDDLNIALRKAGLPTIDLTKPSTGSSGHGSSNRDQDSE